MKVGVAKESAPGERRVALVPEALGKLTAAGLEVLVEAAPATAANSRPRLRRRRRHGRPTAELYAQSDVVVRVQKPDADEVKTLRAEQVLIGLLRR